MLADRIGLPWPRDGGLVIHEAVSRSTGGYAGLFDPSGGQIEVAYYADDGVVLHESAHAWFNGSLLADRWANEAFASYYGLEVADDAQGQGRRRGPHTRRLEAARIPLNAWGPVGREDANDRGLRLRGVAGPRARHRRAGRRGRPARGVGRRVAPRRRVPAAGARGRCHVGGRRRRGRARDGRRPRPTGAACSTCSRSTRRHRSTTCGGRGSRATRTWPCSTRGRPPGHATTRSSRRPGTGSCRAPFATRCVPGSSTRRPSSSTRPETILDQRAAIATAAGGGRADAADDAADRVREPGRLRQRDRSRRPPSSRRSQRYDAAAAARPDESDPLVRLGLWGTTPDADLASARTSFATGDLAGSATAATSALSTWTGAAEAGRGRAVSLGIFVLVLVIGVILAVAWLRGRRRRGRVTMTAGDTGI